VQADHRLPARRVRFSQRHTYRRKQVCSACPTGSFSSTLNALSCTPWITCSAGEEETIAGTGTTDRHCTACPPENYKATVGNTPCIDTTVCKRGFEESEKPTSSSDRLCRSCVAGFTFKATLGQDESVLPARAQLHARLPGGCFPDHLLGPCL
jgi:hypothetical protein